MSKAFEITKDFPRSRERAVLLELLAVTQALKKEGIDAVVCGGWVPFLKELARDCQTSHSMSFDIDVIFEPRRARARQWIASRHCYRDLSPKNRIKANPSVIKKRSMGTPSSSTCLQMSPGSRKTRPFSRSTAYALVSIFVAWMAAKT